MENLTKNQIAEQEDFDDINQNELPSYEEIYKRLNLYENFIGIFRCALKYGIKYKTTGKGNSNLGKEIFASSKTPKLKLDYETHSYLCFEITSYRQTKTCFKIEDFGKTWWLLKPEKINE